MRFTVQNLLIAIICINFLTKWFSMICFISTSTSGKILPLWYFHRLVFGEPRTYLPVSWACLRGLVPGLRVLSLWWFDRVDGRISWVWSLRKVVDELRRGLGKSSDRWIFQVVFLSRLCSLGRNLPKGASPVSPRREGHACPRTGLTQMPWLFTLKVLLQAWNWTSVGSLKGLSLRRWLSHSWWFP